MQIKVGNKYYYKMYNGKKILCKAIKILNDDEVKIKALNYEMVVDKQYLSEYGKEEMLCKKSY